MIQKTPKGKNYNTSSINRIILMIVTSAILIQGALWLMDSIYLFRSDIDEVKKIQTENMKTQLKERVAAVIDYSNYRSEAADEFLRNELKNRTYEAYALMNSIYLNNKDTKSKEEITKMIKDALRDIRFNDGRGYFFIDTLEGDVILYPVFPESEGTNLIALQDERGNFEIKDEIDLVNSSGEGYIEGYWKNPNTNDDNTYRKITFVKAFEAYGWYLGCGDYVDEITKEIQLQVMAYVDSIQYGEDNSQYVFIHDYEGVEIANGSYPEIIGINNYDLEDINGAKVIQEQIHISMQDAGGYLLHSWPKLEGNGQYNKLTYVAPLSNWEWVIGTGVDVTELDELIEYKEKQLENFIWYRIIIIFLILAILIAISMYYIKRFMSKLNKNFTIFKEAMLSAKMKLIPIDVDSLDYASFSELADVTNSMTERINQLLHYDELTAIYNRRYLMELFENEYNENPNAMGIILLDIDFFKKVNDNFGHDVGDKALIIAAQIIDESIPPNAYAGRFGGEEFMVAYPCSSFDETKDVAESIRKNIESHYIKEIDGHITISGGISHSSIHKKDDLFKLADQLLYKAKKSGRNRIKEK